MLRASFLLVAILALEAPAIGQQIVLVPKTVKAGVKTKGLHEEVWERYQSSSGQRAEIVRFLSTNGDEYGGASATRQFIESPGGGLAVLDRWDRGNFQFGARFEDVESGWWASWSQTWEVAGEEGAERGGRYSDFMRSMLALDAAARNGWVRMREVFTTSDGMDFKRVTDRPTELAHASPRDTLDAFDDWLGADKEGVWPPLPSSAQEELQFAWSILAGRNDDPTLSPEGVLERMALDLAARVNSQPQEAQEENGQVPAEGSKPSFRRAEIHFLLLKANGKVVRNGDASAFLRRFGHPYDMDPCSGLEERIEARGP